MKIGWRPEPVSVAIGWDEVWLEVKFQSNSEIAGSPRNIFRYSGPIVSRGRALARILDRKIEVRIKLRMLVTQHRASQSFPAKRIGPKGNNPDQQLRSQNIC